MTDTHHGLTEGSTSGQKSLQVAAVEFDAPKGPAARGSAPDNFSTRVRESHGQPEWQNALAQTCTWRLRRRWTAGVAHARAT